jgi:hypothetical protein
VCKGAISALGVVTIRFVQGCDKCSGSGDYKVCDQKVVAGLCSRKWVWAAVDSMCQPLDSCV